MARKEKGIEKLQLSTLKNQGWGGEGVGLLKALKFWRKPAKSEKTNTCRSYRSLADHSARAAINMALRPELFAWQPTNPAVRKMCVRCRGDCRTPGRCRVVQGALIVISKRVGVINGYEPPPGGWVLQWACFFVNLAFSRLFHNN